MKVKASEVTVGDIVLCKMDETFPADLILLASSAEDNICYINTSSMDGEKNLKKRVILPNMPIPSGGAEPPTADLCTFIGHCKAEKPEISLEKFDGNFYKSRDD